MRRLLPFLLLAAAACAHTKTAPPPPPAPIAAAAPTLPAVPAPPAAPAVKSCQGDADCAGNELCAGSHCVAIEASTASCQGIAVRFDYDRSFIREEDQSLLQRAARCAKARSETGVRIEGHCDERGTVAYNLALGQRRAAATRQYLLDLGVAAGRLSTVSYGKERPRCTEHTEACWATNRRAELVDAR